MAQAAIASEIRPTEGNPPAALLNGLRRLRNRLRAHLVVAGMPWLLAAMLGAFVVSFAIDYRFRLDFSQRTAMLVLGSLILGYVIIQKLVRPLATSASDDALCLAVEHRHPELRQQLVPALQLHRLENPTSKGYSTQLVQAVIERGDQAAASIDFLDTLNFRRHANWHTWLTICSVLFGALVGGIVTTSTLRLWFQRNVLLSSVPWPQATYFEIVGCENHRLKIPRGDDWIQAIHVTAASRNDPEIAYIEQRSATTRSTEPLRKLGQRRFETQFPDVTAPFQFRIRGGDAVTDWASVELVDRPAIDSLELTIEPPSYTGRAAETVVAGRDPVIVPRGSRLKLKGAANKPLSRARLVFASRTQELSLFHETTVIGELSPSEIVAGNYQLLLHDRESPVHLESGVPTSFTLRVVADRAPRVRVDKFGIGTMALPRATLPIRVDASDDYAISAMEFRFDRKSAEGQNVGSGIIPLAASIEQIGKPIVAFRENVALAVAAAMPGETLTLRLAATDNDIVAGPNTSLSLEMPLRIVTEEDFRADILRREKELRQEFEHQYKSAGELMTDTRAQLAAIMGKTPLTDEQRNVLQSIQRRQKQMATSCQSIAERFAVIGIEIENNHLEEKDGPSLTRLRDQILAPFAELNDRLIPEAQLPLDAARRLADQSDARDKSLATTIEKQAAMIAQMQSILRRLEKSEGYQEAVNLLYAILNSQQNVYNLTQKELRNRIQQLLEPERKPKP